MGRTLAIVVEGRLEQLLALQQAAVQRRAGKLLQPQGITWLASCGLGSREHAHKGTHVKVNAPVAVLIHVHQQLQHISGRRSEPLKSGR